MDTDVLIVGGGIAGAATARELARAGIEALLIEQATLNAGASGANAGSLHAQIPHPEFVSLGEDWARAYAPTIALKQASLALWHELGAELSPDLEVATKGGLLVAAHAGQMRDIARKGAIERAAGLAVEMLSRTELLRLAPYLAEDVVGGAVCPVEGKANPLRATPALARAAVAAGARIRQGVALLAIERRAGGGFIAQTSQGPVRAGRIVNAAGANAAAVARMLGVPLPLEGFPIQVNVTERAAPFMDHLVYYASGRLSLKQAQNGTLLIGGGWPAARDAASGRLSLLPQSVAGNLAVASAVVPAIAPLRLVRSWPALVNGTADWKPVLGEVPGVPGFFMAVFPWMGFTGGPIVGRILAELIAGRDPGFDLRPFSPARYA